MRALLLLFKSNKQTVAHKTSLFLQKNKKRKYVPSNSDGTQPNPSPYIYAHLLSSICCIFPELVHGSHFFHELKPSVGQLCCHGLFIVEYWIKLNQH
jgi:hypothetical protein